MIKNILADQAIPGWINSLVDAESHITCQEALRVEFEQRVEALGLPLSQEMYRVSQIHGDCREFNRLSLFVKYHASYGACGLCTKKHWIAIWKFPQGGMVGINEIEFAREVAMEFDRRYPELGIMSLPAEWWQL
jgi:hypothetical protein